MSEQEEVFEKMQPVQHKRKKLYDATVWGYSNSGKNVGVKHNIGHPNGVHWVIDYFLPKNIIKDITE